VLLDEDAAESVSACPPPARGTAACTTIGPWSSRRRRVDRRPETLAPCSQAAFCASSPERPAGARVDVHDPVPCSAPRTRARAAACSPRGTRDRTRRVERLGHAAVVGSRPPPSRWSSTRVSMPVPVRAREARGRRLVRDDEHDRAAICPSLHAMASASMLEPRPLIRTPIRPRPLTRATDSARQARARTRRRACPSRSSRCGSASPGRVRGAARAARRRRRDDAIMPIPMLKTRYISPSSTRPSRWMTRRRGSTGHEPARTTRASPRQDARRLSVIRPP
jgi:hypothetical protein